MASIMFHFFLKEKLEVMYAKRHPSQVYFPPSLQPFSNNFLSSTCTGSFFVVVVILMQRYKKGEKRKFKNINFPYFVKKGT